MITIAANTAISVSSVNYSFLTTAYATTGDSSVTRRITVDTVSAITIAAKTVMIFSSVYVNVVRCLSWRHYNSQISKKKVGKSLRNH